MTSWTGRGLVAGATETIDVMEAVVLGIVQGISEWLPISSSGHLALSQEVFGPHPFAYDLVIHLATVLVLIVHYRRDIVAMIASWVLSIPIILDRGWAGLDVPAGAAETERRWRAEARMAWLVLIATIPTGLVGLAIDRFLLTEVRETLGLIGTMLLLTAVLLVTTRWAKSWKDAGDMTVWHALVIGMVQGVAALPGISRSGMTIATAVHLGYTSEDAGRFSFLLAIPAIIGANIGKWDEVGGLAGRPDLGAMVIGALVAFVVGYLALTWLLRMLRTEGRLALFAPYLIIVGLVAVLLDAGLL